MNSLKIVVALLAEGVDRNSHEMFKIVPQDTVALLAEGVDRNAEFEVLPDGQKKVALLAEGVDRNQGLKKTLVCGILSPSSRRAWIEICEIKRQIFS